MADASGWIGVFQGIKNFQKENQEAAAKKALADLEFQNKEKWHAKKLQMDLDWDTNPENVQKRAQAEVGQEAFTLQYGLDTGLPELRGESLEREEIARKNQKYYNLTTIIPGTDGITAGEYYQNVDALQEYNKFMARNQYGLDFLEQEKKNGDAAQLLGLPRNTSPKDVAVYTKQLETKLNMLETKMLFNTDVAEGGGTPEQREVFYKAKKEELGDPLTLSKNLRILSAEAPWVTISPDEDYDLHEQRKLDKDIIDTMAGKINRIDFDEKQVKMMNDINVPLGYKKVGYDLAYITFDKLENFSLKNGAERKLAAQSVISQYAGLPQEVYETLRPIQKRRIQNSLARAINLLYSENENFTTVDGKAVLKEGRVVDQDNLGVFWQDLPKYVQNALKMATTDETFKIDEPPANNKVAIADKENGSISYQTVELDQEVINSVLPPQLANKEKMPVSKDAALNAIVTAHAIAEGNNLSVYESNSPEFAEAVAEVEQYPIRTQGVYALHNVMFKPNTLLLSRSLVNTRIKEEGVAQAASFAYLEATNGPAVTLGGLKIDPYKYYQTLGELAKANLNDKILLSDPAWLSYTRDYERNDLTRGGGTRRIPLKLNFENYGKALNINREEASNALTFAQPAYDSGIALLDNIARSGVASSFVGGLVQFFDGLKALPSQFYSGFYDFAQGGGDISALNGFTGMLSGITNLIQTGDYDPEMVKTLSLAQRGVGESFAATSEEEMLDNLKGLMGNPKPTQAQLVAQQKMLHAAFVFYTAAAFQGEGGKAISDGDRKFVEWALSYGTFTSVDQRRHAIAGMLKIIGKSKAVNELLASNDPKDNYVGKNYNKLFGDSVITVEEIPYELRNDPLFANLSKNSHRTISEDVVNASREVGMSKDVSQGVEKEISLGTTVPATVDVGMSGDAGQANVAVSPEIEPQDLEIKVKNGILLLRENADEATIRATARNARDATEFNKIANQYPELNLVSPFE